MIIASSASPFTATGEAGIGGLVGVISIRVVDTDDNVIIAPSTANILELTDGVTDTGVYVAARTAPAVTATTYYVVEWSSDGTYDPETVFSEDMAVVVGTVSPVLPPIPVTPGVGPQVGPCTAWTTGEDVAACCSVAAGTNTSVFDDAIGAASQLLFALSGEQFNGQCEQTVRPCADGCGCWGAITWPASPGVPQIPVGYGGFGFGYWGALGWGWGYDGATNLCGCAPVSRAALPGFPVTSITQVLIDGVVLPELDDDGVLNWRLDGWRWLTRMADVNGQPRFWPACQDIAREDDQPGTWAVTYTFGQSTPILGVIAATSLACEIYKSCAGAGDCALPVGAVKINRQGIEIERAPFLSWAQINGRWATGIPTVDAFLTVYNPIGLRRPASVWSPDLPQFGSRLGTGSGE